MECCGTIYIICGNVQKKSPPYHAWVCSTHVLAWMQVMGSWDMLPKEFLLDLSCNLRPGSDYFEKSSNSVIHVDIILTDGSWFCKLSNYVNFGLYALFDVVMSNFMSTCEHRHYTNFQVSDGGIPGPPPSVWNRGMCIVYMCKGIKYFRIVENPNTNSEQLEPYE